VCVCVCVCVCVHVRVRGYMCVHVSVVHFSSLSIVGLEIMHHRRSALHHAANGSSL